MGTTHGKILRARGDVDKLTALLPEVEPRGENSTILATYLLEVGHPTDRRAAFPAIVAAVERGDEVGAKAFYYFMHNGADLVTQVDKERALPGPLPICFSRIFKAAVAAPNAGRLLEMAARATARKYGYLAEMSLHGTEYLADAHAAGLDHVAIAFAYAMQMAPLYLDVRFRMVGGFPCSEARLVVDRASLCSCRYCVAIVNSYEDAYGGTWWEGIPLLARERAYVQAEAAELVARFGCKPEYAEQFAHLIGRYCRRRSSTPAAAEEPPPYEVKTAPA